MVIGELHLFYTTLVFFERSFYYCGHI
jgi:hypothetical protein